MKRASVFPASRSGQLKSRITKAFAVTVVLALTVWFNTTFSTLHAQSPGIYPLKVSSNGRYLVGQNDVPFLIVGDSPQGLISDLSTTEADAYFANRASYGFNAVQIHLFGGTTFGGRIDYSTYDGVTPFTTAGDISTTNETYFARVDAVLNLAAQHGIVVFLTAAETIDSLGLFRSNGVAKSRAFGQYVGNRYKNFDNIVWVNGNDFQTWRTASDNAVILAVANGIKDTDSRHLHTAWLDYFVSASRDSPDWEAMVDLDLAYTYYATYAKVLDEYARVPSKPVFLGESNYEEDSISVPLTTPQIVRRQEYWAMTSGATGSFYGNYWTWPFKTGWQDHYDSPGAAQMPYFKNLFQARSWWKLVPDRTHQVITGGYGTYEDTGSIAWNDYVTAALASDSSFMIAYLPTIRTVTVDMSKLSGPVTAQWFDPSNGSYYPISGSPFSNSGTQQFTPAGNNSDGDGDWLLVLDKAVPILTPPTVALKVNGLHPSPPIVTTTGPMMLTLDVSPTTSTAPLSWYWLLIVNNQVVWVTSKGPSMRPGPLAVAPPVPIVTAPLLSIILPPATTLVSFFFLADSGGAVVALDVIAATRP